MAGENLGSVFYTVDADTSAMLKAEAQIDKSIDGIVKDFDKADMAVKDFMKTQASLGRVLNESGQIIDSNGNAVADASIEYRKLAKEAERLRASTLQQSQLSKQVQAGFKGVGRSAGQAGIQIQQFIGQVQGGQSAMLALSQQSADLGFVLGAPLIGAITGIAASLVGILVPSLLDSSNGMEELEKGIEKVKAAMTLSVDGIANYSDEMQKLSEISERLLEIKLANLIAEQAGAVNKAAMVASESINGLRGSFDTFNDVIEDTFGSITKEGIDAFGELRSAADSLKLAPTAENIEKLEAALDSATEAGINNTKQGRELADTLINMIFSYKEGKIVIDELTEALENNEKVTESSAQKVEDLVNSINAQAETLGFSKRELALYAAEQSKATEEDIKAINASFDKIEAYEKEVKAQKERKDAIIATNKALDALFKKEEAQAQAQADREAARASKRAETVTSQTQGLADSSDPVRLIEAQREKQLAIVREYEQLETAEHQVAVDARKAIDDEYNSKLAAAQEARFVAQSESNALLIDGINALGDASASVLTGMLTQTLDLKSAMLGLANSILNSAVNAIIQMGIEYVKSALIGQAADEALAASQAATAAANAATHTTAVAATVAELTSLAAAGAFAATAAIPIVGPAAAPAAAGAAAAATTALGATAIASAPVAGMRLYGGSAAPNSLYKVTEDGRPEMFSDGRDSFLMTGSRGGAVTSNGDLGGSGDQINIVVNNNAPGSKATASYDEQSKTVNIAINEIGKQFRQNSGPAFDGLIAGTTANGRAT